MRKRSNFFKAFLLVGVMIFLAAGCQKYEEGPLLSLRSKAKRLENTWKLEKYLLNGEDATSTLLISNYTEDYTKDGVYTRSYTDTDGESFSETGDWAFGSSKEKLDISDVSSLELSEEHSTVSSSHYNILKLKNDELWYSYENGGDTHEFHLVTK